MNVREAVDSVIEPAFNSERITGSRMQKSICDLTIFYKKKLTKDSKEKKVVDLSSYIHNRVIGLLKDQTFYNIEAAYGTMLVTDNIKLIGQCLSTGKEVHFITEWPCRKGDKFPYHRIGSKYYLENYFPGAIKKPNDYLFGEQGNFLVQRSELCTEYKDKTGYEERFGQHILSKTNIFNYPKEEIWYKSRLGIVNMTYVKNGIYTERKITKDEVTLEIDCTAHLTPTTDSSGSVSHEGTIDGTYVIKAPRVVRILHIGNFAILQVLREKRTTMPMVDTVGYARWCYPVETGTLAYNSVSIFSLIIIDTVNKTTNLLDYTPTSTWFNLTPMTIAGGYLDIQVDKNTGDLLVIKSDSSISTSNITVDYFETDGSFTTELYELDGSDDPIHYPVADGSQSCSIKNVGFTLYSAKLGMASLDLETLTPLYTQAATITTLQGASVVGGCRSMTFTQEPENFNIYFKVHKIGYKNINHDFYYTPTNGDDTRIEQWQRCLTSLGVIEILDIGGVEKFKILTTELGLYGTMTHRTGSLDPIEIAKLSTAITFNHVDPMSKAYAFRSEWPALEATMGSTTLWDNYNSARNDFPDTVGFGTPLLETRFADVFFGSGFTRPKQYIPVVEPFSIADIVPTGDVGFIRNDPDLFMSFSEAGNEGPLFVLFGNYDITYGRETSDTEAEFNDTSRTLASWMYSQAFPLLSKFRDIDNQPHNMIAYDEEPEKFPTGSDHLHYAYKPPIGTVEFPIQHGLVGFSHFSVFRVSKWHAFCLLNRQYFDTTYDLSGPSIIGQEVSCNSLFILITSDSTYYPSPVIADPTRETCLWSWTPDEGIIINSNGPLKIASIGNRLHITGLEDLMDNALQ